MSHHTRFARLELELFSLPSVFRLFTRSSILKIIKAIDAHEKMNKAFFLGLHSLFLSLKQRHQIIFNYAGKFVFSTFNYRLPYGGRGKAQRPCKTGSASDYKNLAPPGNKVPIVDLVFKYGLALNPPYNDVVQCSWRIYPGFSRHGGGLTSLDPFVNFSPASPTGVNCQ